MRLIDHNKIALIWEDNKVSYSELISKKQKFASLINSRQGERALIISENRFDYAYALYSIWHKGLVPVPVDYLSSEDEITFIVKDCNPSVIYCTNITSPKIKPENFKDIDCNIINIDKIEIEKLNEDKSDAYEFEADETLVIIYTSGTTGSPKGVMLTRGNIEANVYGVTEYCKIYTGNDVTMVFLPLHHSFPLIGTLVLPLSSGGSVAFTPSLASEDIMRTLQNNKVSIIIGVPRFYEMIIKGIREKINAKLATRLIFKLAKRINSIKTRRKIFAKVHEKFGGNVRYMVCGGASIDKNIIEDYYTLGLEVLEGYGMTEAAPMISFSRPGDVVYGSAGRPLPGCEIRIEDGEILARGKNIMRGYFNRPLETAELIKDGWLHTGDLGSIDQEQNIFVTGRKKEIIVLSNGKNINPVEIENDYYSQSARIKEIAVFDNNDLLYAAILPETKSDEIIKELDTIKNEYNLRVSGYKRIAKIIIIDQELPRTRLGKIQRYKLVDFLNGTVKAEPQQEPEFEEYKLLKKYLVELKKTSVNPLDNLEFDLGLDSLDKVNLQVFCQLSFGINIDSSDFKKYENVEHLAKYIAENKTQINIETINWGKILKEKIDDKLPKSWLSQIVFFKLIKVFFKFYFRIKSEGSENVPDTACILACNHQSFYDGFFISSFMKSKHLKQTLFYAKEKHLNNGILKFFAQRHNVIIMDINKDVKESIQKMALALRKGKKIMIFPEGTRTTDGKLGQFKQTFAILSKELNVPVVPVVIKGAFEALPKGRLIPSPFKKISIKFLKPVYPDKATSENLVDKVYNTFLSHI